MNVKNKSDQPVHVPGYGTIPAGETAVVQQGGGVKELIKAGVLSEVQASSDKKGGDK